MSKTTRKRVVTHVAAPPTPMRPQMATDPFGVKPLGVMDGDDVSRLETKISRLEAYVIRLQNRIVELDGADMDRLTPGRVRAYEGWEGPQPNRRPPPPPTNPDEAAVTEAPKPATVLPLREEPTSSDPEE